MNEIKNYLTDNLGNEFFITVDKDKKCKKTMRCVIKETYSSLFLVDVLDEEFDNKRTFTYSEVYCKSIEIEKA